MEPFFNSEKSSWRSVQSLEPKAFVCGFCDHKVSSRTGYGVGEGNKGVLRQIGGVYICPHCQGPTFLFFQSDFTCPTPAMGNPVRSVPEGLNALYEEARRCTSAGCYTAAVLLCRKMLMNIAVEQGADEGLQFIKYVNFLSDKGFTPPNGKRWVDHIRQKGNEATHEIALMGKQEAAELLVFTEMLLKFNYEFEAMLPSVT